MVSDKQARQTARKRWRYHNEPGFAERCREARRRSAAIHPDIRTADDRREWRHQYYQANAEYCRAYSRQYRRDHLDYYRDRQREYREQHPEYYQRLLELADIRRSDPAFLLHRKKYLTNYRKHVRDHARLARQNLRSLMKMDPRITKLINSCIDLSSASDAEVRRFYLGLERAFSE